MNRLRTPVRRALLYGDFILARKCGYLTGTTAVKKRTYHQTPLLSPSLDKGKGILSTAVRLYSSSSPARERQKRPFSADHNKKSKSQEPNDDERSPVNKTSARIGTVASLGIGASIVLGKMKYVLVALKLTKMAPLASMVITSGTYALFFGWPYAIGMVGLIFFHECGHAVVMHRYNVPFSPMVFVPFMGAVIAMKDRPRNSYEEAVIALGGPVVGTAAAVGAAVAGNALDSQLLIALADWGYMINLFNLLPIGSLDGGRIANAISPSIGVVGLMAGGALIYYGVVHNPIFYLIMLSGIYSTGTRIFGGAHEEPKSYYKISGARQLSLLSAYLGLIAALVMAMYENNKRRKTPRQLKYEQSTPGYDSTAEPWARDGQEDGVYDDFFSFENHPDDDERW